MSADMWLLALFAFFFGVLTGWLLSRRAANGDSAARPPVDADASGGKAPAGAPEQLDALEAVLKEAKLQLQQQDGDAASAEEALAELDDAIKRANGRLKLIMKTLRLDDEAKD